MKVSLIVLLSGASKLNMINNGVPQGYILVTLLFLVHLTGVPSIIDIPNQVCLYADNIHFPENSI